MVSAWSTEKEKLRHHYTAKHLLRRALFLSVFLFAWLLLLIHHFSFRPKETTIAPDDNNSERNDNVVRSTCNANYSVYMYDLPAEFNSGLTADCKNLSVYTDMCPHVANRGLGRPLTGLGPNWFATHQFLAELIFHARVENHPCRTRDPSRASLFYVPFYGGLHASSKFRDGNLTSRDALAVKLAGFLRRQKWFQRSSGKDHFLALGRTAWDFTRSNADTGESGANALLTLPELTHVTVLTVERNPWQGKNQKGIPYPSYLHPSTLRDVSAWQSAARHSRRPHLFSFVGGSRPAGLEKAAVRERLFRQCGASSRCELMTCGGACHDPRQVMGVMMGSDFCLQAPGDSFTRRSTFDAVLGGCVPVFFSEHTAYSQYGWFFGATERDEWSVMIDEKSPQSDRVEALLAGIPRATVARMRERVIQLIPRLTYAHPDAAHGKGFHDVVDVALASLANHLRDL